jgi:hypothetical protein
LQDAGRLDALSHIGIARCFYVSGRLGRAVYDFEDPDASSRELDDAKYAIDHFQTKLLRLAGSFQTDTGRKLGEERHHIVKGFADGLLAEVSLEPSLSVRLFQASDISKASPSLNGVNLPPKSQSKLALNVGNEDFNGRIRR